jgi:hypothetical protein
LLRAAARSKTAAASAGADQFSVAGPLRVEAGAEITDTLRVAAGGDMHAFSAHLAWDATVVEPVATQGLGFVESQGGVVLSPKPGTVDAALLGVSSSGISGTGDVAIVRFRALKSGAPAVALGSVDARDASNQHLLQATTAAVPLPTRTLLLAPAPNPTRGSATLSFALAHRSNVNLIVYDIAGRRVRTLVSGVKDPGAYRMSWDAHDDGGRAVGTGVYYVAFEADGLRMNQRLVLLR